jgi:uncharacterized protein (TIGR03083 family)
MTTIDYDRLRYEELESIGEFCHSLEASQWDTPSLCEGWRVRDVIGHMSIGYTTGLPTMMAKMARYRFNVPKASKAESIAFATSRTPDELLAVFDSIYQRKIRKGITHFIKPSEGLLDHVVHHQDMRRPLGLARQIPEHRLVAALGVAPRLSGFVGSKGRSAGIRLVATDIEWSHGDGPEVRGPGEAILLAVTGRSVALDELDGEGVGELEGRIAA